LMTKAKMFSVSIRVDVPAGDHVVTEAAVKRCIKSRLRECPLGGYAATAHVGDVVEFSDQMILRAREVIDGKG
jgi:hypothetical protein